jgi:hypothetical protein
LSSNIPATRFVQLQRKLVQDKLRAIDDIREAVLIRSAAQEASALSWESGFPLLAFPILFDERSAIALARVKRQQEIYERSRQLLGLRGGSRESSENPAGESGPAQRFRVS